MWLCGFIEMCIFGNVCLLFCWFVELLKRGYVEMLFCGNVYLYICGNVCLCKCVFAEMLFCANCIVNQKHEERGYYLRVLRVIH